MSLNLSRKRNVYHYLLYFNLKIVERPKNYFHLKKIELSLRKEKKKEKKYSKMIFILGFITISNKLK